MIFIVGGYFQGKREYANTQFSISNWVSGEEASFESLVVAEGVYHFQEYLEKIWKKGECLEKHCQGILRENPNLLIVMEEMGCGILPLEREKREFLNQVGELMEFLSKEAREVHRVICGIGRKIHPCTSISFDMEKQEET